MDAIKQVPSYIQDGPKSLTDENAAAVLPKLQPTTSGQFIYIAAGVDEPKGNAVDVVIFAVTPPANFVNHRTCYENDFDSEQSGGPPICASPDGVNPFTFIQKPQCDTCAKCQWAVLGSKGKGQLSKCASFKQIYAAFPENLEEVFRLKAPITTLRQLGNYRALIKNSGGSIAGAVTRISFDPAETNYAKMQFDFSRWLPEAEFKIATELAISNQLQQITGATQAALPAPPVVSTGTEVIPPVAPAVKAEPEVTPPAAPPVVSTEPEVILPTTASPLDLLNVMLPAVEPVLSKFDAMLAAVNKCLDTQALSDYLNSIAQDLKTITKDQMDTLRESVTQKQADLLNVLTASNPSELPGVLEGILKKADPQQHLAAFIELANKVTGVVFDAALHGVSGNKFPALTQAGQYKKSKTRKNTTEVATPATVENLLDNLNKL